MKKIFLFLSVLCNLAIFAQNSKNSTEREMPLFADGETVVFFGNSITHGGTYHSFINLFYLTRFPECNIKIINSGISGNELPGGIARLETDVLVHNPDVIVIMYGMNDSRVDGINPGDSEKDKQVKLQSRIDYYRQNLDSVSGIIRSKGIRIIYIAPTIYDDLVDVEAPIRYGGNKALGMCREVVYEIAEKYNSPVVDFYTVMNKVNARFQQDDPKFTVVGADRVHPGKEGHLLMAYQFLKAQGVPALVSRIAIDVKSISVVEQENCRVSSLSADNNLISFSAKSNALPFPELENEACNWVPVVDDLNLEILQAEGMSPGLYTLSIDNEYIADFESTELVTGVNLANFSNTPQYQQAELVSEINDLRNDLVRDRIRSLALFDFGWFKNTPDNQPLDSIAMLFEKELAKIEDKSYYPYIKDQARNYLMYKPMLDETREAVLRFEKTSLLLAQPVWHKYQLRKKEINTYNKRKQFRR